MQKKGLLMMFADQKGIYLMIAALMVVSQVCMGSSVPAQPFRELDQRAPGPGPADDFAGQMGRPPGESPPLGLSYSGRGFALKEDESHDLMMTVVNLMPPDPMQVRRLLASNKSIEEIRDEINAMQERAIYRGFIKLDEMVYPLIDINSSPSGGDSISLYAYVVEPALDLTISNKTSIAGSLRVMISPCEGRTAGKGELIINRGPHAGTYDVTLDVQPMEPD
ncbi:MAG: hypothetical protein A4E48_00909 [Methanosaeta sp. PtaU1.Bin060]|nr:MAG: hypothetical protein A4E48_00909 [Methanosaeta sp. PtaU1.Bin060]